MYNIKPMADLAINSQVLLNSSKESLDKLLTKLDIDPRSLEDMLRTIHEWYQKEPHLPEGQLHDQFILRILVTRKFSIQKVKLKIENYYTVRPKLAEILSNRDPLAPTVNTYLRNAHWIVLPRTTPENYRVTVFRLKSCEGVNIIDMLKTFLMIIDYRLWNDSVMGEQVILDYENITLQLTMQATPVIISKIIFYITECVGPNVKGVHIVNMPVFADTVLSLVKRILKPKMVKRVHLYKSFHEILSKFPKSIFPKDLGGTDEVTCQEIADNWVKTLSSAAWRNYFIEQDYIYTDESKRIKINNFHDDFGLDGSFKKLTID